MSSFEQFFRLSGTVCHYAWGSRACLQKPPYIAELLGQDAGDLPWAELWLGGHPEHPSRVTLAADSIGLDVLTQDYPAEILGQTAKREFPFLLKILSCEQPLSIQCHPDSRNAKRLHWENPQLYRDANAKPEILIALTDFRALAGFRALSAAVQDLTGKKAFAPWLSLWQREFPADWQGLCQALFALPAVQSQALLLAAIEEIQTDTDDISQTEKLFLQLSAFAPADLGALFAFLLHLVQLKPGEAIFLPPGKLHAYLHGTGIECMASSDNVIRAGLTNKTLDLTNFWRCADFTSTATAISPGRTVAPGQQEYPLPGCAITVKTLRDCDFILPDQAAGPSILLLLSGRGELSCKHAPAHQADCGSAWLRPAALNNASFRPLERGTYAVWAG